MSHDEPLSNGSEGDFFENDYQSIFKPRLFDRIRSTRDRDGILDGLDGIGHGVFVARKAERHIWYGNARAALALTEGYDHPLAQSVRARACYLLGDLASASTLTERLLAPSDSLSPLCLEARLLAHETDGLSSQFAWEDHAAALIHHGAARALAQALGMVHKVFTLEFRMNKFQRRLQLDESSLSAFEKIVDHLVEPPNGEDGSQGDPGLPSLGRAISAFQGGEVFLAGHMLGSPPRVDAGRDETAWWSCLALQILATTRDVAVARPAFAFHVLQQMRAQRAAFAMQRSNAELVKTLYRHFPLGFALAVSHPDLANWRYAVHLLPVVRLDPKPGIFVDGRKVVTINWRVRDDLVAQAAQGRTLLAAMHYGARPGNDREWRRLLNLRMKKADLTPERLCSAREYDNGLAALRRTLPNIPFDDVLAPLVDVESS